MLKQKITYLYEDAVATMMPADEFADKVIALVHNTAAYPWLKEEDLQFAILYYQESKIEAIKWLAEKARPHVCHPLKTAKEILDGVR